MWSLTFGVKGPLIGSQLRAAGICFFACSLLVNNCDWSGVAHGCNGAGTRNTTWLCICVNIKLKCGGTQRHGGAMQMKAPSEWLLTSRKQFTHGHCQQHPYLSGWFGLDWGRIDPTRPLTRLSSHAQSSYVWFANIRCHVLMSYTWQS